MANAKPPKGTGGGPGGEFKWAPGAQHELRMGVGHGFLNMLLYAEDRAKENAVVRGGNRSFLTGSHLGGPLGIKDRPGTSRARPTVGGNLRRSFHAIVYVNGSPLGGSHTVDQNGESAGGYPTGGGDVVGILGTNSGYGLWVDQGTSRMPARPMVMPAIRQMQGAAQGLFEAGAGGYWRRRK